MLYLAPSSIHGTGVHTRAAITEGDQFHISEMLVLDPLEVQTIKTTRLANVLYQIGDTGGIALSPMCMANHARPPNTKYEVHEDTNTVHFTALTFIPAGTEITIDYGGFAKVLGIV